MPAFEYEARLDWSEDDGEYLVTFPDVPEAITAGATKAEALEMAADALEVALAGRMKDGEDIPVPSATRGEGGYLVTVSPLLAAKLAVYKRWRELGISKSELARRLGVREAEVRRILDPHHATKIERLDAAMRAMGQRLVIDIQAA
jgi:antitoxin HicB